MWKTFVVKLGLCVFGPGSTYLVNAVQGAESAVCGSLHFTPEAVSPEMINQRARARMVEQFGFKEFNRGFFGFALRLETYFAVPTNQDNIWNIVLMKFCERACSGKGFPGSRACTALEFVGLVAIFMGYVLAYAESACVILVEQSLPAGSDGRMMDACRGVCKFIFLNSCRAVIVRTLVRMGFNGVCVSRNPSEALPTDGLNMTDTAMLCDADHCPVSYVHEFTVLFRDNEAGTIARQLQVQDGVRTCCICKRGFLNTHYSFPAFYTTSGSITSGAFGIISTLLGPLPVESALIDVCHIGCILGH